jgi:hypothetical protein
MNLPLVLDIALGLIFIYLIASLLASEIQELIATLLQWRAEHLKKSIEVLINGENLDSSADQSFVDRLYKSPLIRSLNQEAKGLFARSFRRLSHGLGSFYRQVTRTRNVFGNQHSGPSYLPAETFAVALLQQLHLEPLLQTLHDQAIATFVSEKLARVEDILESLRNSVGDDSLLEVEFADLRRNLTQLTTRTSLGNPSDSIQGRLAAIAAQIRQFIAITEALLQTDDHPQAIIRQRLAYLKSEMELQHPMPTIADAVALILDPTQRANLPPELIQLVEAIRSNNPAIPESLRRSLTALAQQALNRADDFEVGVLQLQKEIETWFDRSMERASGVYRRNARGVAILIGFALAIATNADTLHMVDRLSKDTLLRSTVTQAADQVVAQTAVNSSPDAIAADLQAVRDAVDRSLDGLLLPVGWDELNVQQQQQESGNWPPLLRRLLGWFVTGLALSMGANFWYNLLARFIHIRNTGRSRSTGKDG